MRHLVNIVSNLPMLEPFGGRQGLEKYIKQDCGCDAAEVISCPPYAQNIVQGCTVGYHLMFYPNWLDFYTGNKAYLQKHFGAEQVWLDYYGCADAAGFERRFVEDMDRAQELGAEYAVLHCADVSNEEVLLNYSLHSNVQVIRATAEFINNVMRGRKYSFTLLIENLFVPGMTLISSAETGLLFDLIEYENKGIMLDTGHLMAALRLAGQLEQPNEYAAAAAIKSVLDAHGELKSKIKGIHLHRCALTMPLEKYTAPLEPLADFNQRSEQSYARILALDTHSPLETAAMRSIIDYIAPSYIVHEISAASPQAKAQAIKKQLRSLYGCCL